MTYQTETMSQPEFSDYISTERERLTERKHALLDTQRQIAHDLDAISAEFEAIEAYERVKTGKTSKAAKSNGAVRATRTRRGSKREEILNTVAMTEGGMSRADILHALDVKGDKSGEMSVSNALTALTKAAQLYRENGKYFVFQAA